MGAKTIYITPEEYAIGEKNGIPPLRVYVRVNTDNWSIERAITEPVGQRKKYPELFAQWEELKERNGEGVGFWTFVKRVKKGMKPEEAIKKDKPKITKELRELAAKNGIPQGTFEQRVYAYKHDPYEAATTPVEEKFRPKGSVKNG